MTEDRHSGTDERRTDSNVSESTTADDASVTAENEQLRERVADLEAALAEVQAKLDEQSADTSEDSAGETSEPIDTAGEPTADGTKPLVTAGGKPTKVIGRLGDDQGIGILGEATASSTVTYGVEGITQSLDNDAAGIRASASNGARGLVAEATGNRAIEAFATNDDAIYAETDDSAAVFATNTATSGRAYGVRGNTRSTGDKAFGVLGEAQDSSGATKGVTGFTYGGGDGAAGVYGKARSSSGFVHGVKGETDSPAGYGLYTPGDAGVVGTVSVGKVGVSTYLSSNQTIDSGNTTTVAFDETVVDHFDGLDTISNSYTIPESGDYHVSFTVNWADSFDAGVSLDYTLWVNGVVNQQVVNVGTTTAGTNQDVVRSVGRTLFGLGSGDTIKVNVSQDSGSQKDIDGGSQRTYMTIHKVG